MNLKERIQKRQQEKLLKELGVWADTILNYANDLKTKYNNKTKEEMYQYFKTRYQQLLNRDEDVVEVYAMGYLIIEKELGLTLHKVQLIGALALYKGYIAEMKTGEGKTVTSILPVLMNALDKTKGVFVVTVNEYLARRDKEELEKVYQVFGLTTALNLQQDSIVQKQQWYQADIMYATASTLGFDYLQDNLVYRIQDKLNPLQKRGFVLIDEVDLILIDEARTPLIIGNEIEDSEVQATKYQVLKARNFVLNLLKTKPNTVMIDKKHRVAMLNEEGLVEFRKSYGLDSLDTLNSVNVSLNLHLVYQSLVAQCIYEEGVDYLLVINPETKVKEVQIIDTFTGRIQEGRRYTYGLHSALEAKHSQEGVEILPDTLTIATITLQNFFRRFDKVVGMSGTSKEEKDEFVSIYGLQVLEIPTNLPPNRYDHLPKWYKSKESKFKAIIKLVEKLHREGQPVLIGTVTLEDSEKVSKLLNESHLPHTVLNARQDKEEAQIVEKAGKRGAITVATNMAGRGTDIKVDKNCTLVVILTELNESERIDNQLKGRTSRQGELGYTHVYISCEDMIFVNTGMVERMKELYGKFALLEDNYIPSSILKLCRGVQKELEGYNTSSRSQALQFDEVIKAQREVVYQSRDDMMKVVDFEEFKERQLQYLNHVYETLKMQKSTKKEKKQTLDQWQQVSTRLKDRLEQFEDCSSQKLEQLKVNWLQVLDKEWVKHISNLDALKNGIHYRVQGTNENVNGIYQQEARNLFSEMKWESLRKWVEQLEVNYEIKD